MLEHFRTEESTPGCLGTFLCQKINMKLVFQINFSYEKQTSLNKPNMTEWVVAEKKN